MSMIEKGQAKGAGVEQMVQIEGPVALIGFDSRQHNSNLWNGKTLPTGYLMCVCVESVGEEFNIN